MRRYERPNVFGRSAWATLSIRTGYGRPFTFCTTAQSSSIDPKRTCTSRRHIEQQIPYTFQHLMKYTIVNSSFESERQMEITDAAKALDALGHESRLATYRALIQAGPAGLAASKIAEAVGISPSSLTFHLKELGLANLVTSRQEGRFVIYSAQFETMNALLGFLTENCCGGNPCTPAATLCKAAI